MNKFVILALVSLTILAYATGHPRAKNGTEKNEGGRKKKFTACALEKCPKEVEALKALFHAPKQQTECEKKCNPENKKFHHLSEEEVKKIRQCYADNNCLKDPKQRFNHRNSTEFQAFKKCAREKCPEDYKNFKGFSTTVLPLNNTTSK